MKRPKCTQAGFGGVEIAIILTVLGVLGGFGWVVWRAQQTGPKPMLDTATSTGAATADIRQRPDDEDLDAVDPYEGWSTYTSILKSGVSFRYPSDWTFADGQPPTQAITNQRGGVKNRVTVYSAKPATGRFMCMTIDEYGDPWDNSEIPNLQLGATLASERFTSGGKVYTLSSHRGDTPMQTRLLLARDPASPKGTHYSDTAIGFYMTAIAGFNCDQADPAGIGDLRADFDAQPETAVVRQILKSTSF